jgi:hypothetical protein
MTSQRHASAVLRLGKEVPLSIKYEAGWASEPGLTLWRKNKFVPCRESNRDYPNVQPLGPLVCPYSEVRHVLGLLERDKGSCCEILVCVVLHHLETVDGLCVNRTHLFRISVCHVPNVAVFKSVVSLLIKQSLNSCK